MSRLAYAALRTEKYSKDHSSFAIPSDLCIEPKDIRKCQICRWEGGFSEFKFIGSRSKVATKIPTKIELWVRRLFNKPYLELDVRKLYLN